MNRFFAAIVFLSASMVGAASNRSLSDEMNDPLGSMFDTLSNLSACAQNYLQAEQTEEQLPVEEAACSICLEPQFTEPVTLQCNHTFCNPCITDHFKTDVRCPLCRAASSQNHQFNFSRVAPQFQDQIKDFILSLNNDEYARLMRLGRMDSIEEALIARPDWVDAEWLPLSTRKALFRKTVGLSSDVPALSIPEDKENTQRSLLHLQENDQYFRECLPKNRTAARNQTVHQFNFNGPNNYVHLPFQAQVTKFIHSLTPPEYTALIRRYGHTAEREISEHQEWFDSTLDAQTRNNLFRASVGLSTNNLVQEVPEYFSNINLLRFLLNYLYALVEQGLLTPERANLYVEAYTQDLFGHTDIRF